jgi:hypothetical protein
MIFSGREDAPVVERRIVAEALEQGEGAGVVVGRGVEEELRVGNGLASVVVMKHVLEIADPHVVRHDGEVLAAEIAPGDGQVAHRGGERPGRVEARIDPRSLALEAGDAA